MSTSPLWHRLLLRQLKKAGISLDTISPQMTALLTYVNEAYSTSDNDRALYEHVMDLTTKELVESNNNLKISLAKAETATRAKSDFLANMSHEIRTPLHGILGLLDLLREQITAEDQSKILSMLTDSAKGLHLIVDDILDFSKIEAGRLSIIAVPTNLREVINKVVSLYAAPLESQKLTIVTEYFDTLPTTVLIDEHRLRQILSNLLSNAIKFTPVEGAILIFAFADEITPKEAILRIAVCDTGIGIADDKLHYIFQPFSQADCTTTRKFGGSGLGLAISQRLTQLMKGNLWVRSIENVGSVFHLAIKVPIIKVVQQSSFEHSIHKKLNHNIRALLAEDNLVNQKIAVHFLEKAGCVVTTAVNGKEAVEKFAQEDFDVIIMDCQMPILSGFEATQEIRRMPKGSSIPIIALTALAIEGDRERCLVSGMSDYLTKPVDKKKLTEALTRWVGTRLS